MKETITTKVRHSFSTNPPKKSSMRWDSTTGNWGIMYTLENGEYRLVKNIASWGLGTIEDDEWCSLYVREPFLLLFSRWKRLDIADKFLLPIFVDFYVRRK